MSEVIKMNEGLRQLSPLEAADYVQFKSESLGKAIADYIETYHHAHGYTESGRFDYATMLGNLGSVIRETLRTECKVELDGDIEDFIVAYTAHTKHPFVPVMYERKAA